MLGLGSPLVGNALQLLRVIAWTYSFEFCIGFPRMYHVVADVEAVVPSIYLIFEPNASILLLRLFQLPSTFVFNSIIFLAISMVPVDWLA